MLILERLTNDKSHVEQNEQPEEYYYYYKKAKTVQYL